MNSDEVEHQMDVEDEDDDANQCQNVFQDGVSGIVRRTELVQALM
jgi:hypothetical protein